ncbi:MAG: CoA transferase, partial [Deltaproteobacteria bacterium]|nr:CoA transferase [Deltaproteobacteria bacterium]
KLCNLIGCPELVTDERFNNNGNRTTNVKELMVLLNNIFITKTINEWLELLEKAELPCAPINTIDKVVNDPQIKAREMMVELEHPIAGHQKMAGVPVKMSATPGQVEFPAPMLGQHTAEILQEMFGWDQEKTDKFFREAK